MKPRKQYPSDVSREQFERVRPLLEGVRKRTKPRTVDLYEVFNAVLYLLKSGWRVAYAPRWISQVAHGAFLLRQVERTRTGWRQRSGASLKKNPLARPVPNRDATP
jgi:hypothetical protein